MLGLPIISGEDGPQFLLQMFFFFFFSVKLKTEPRCRVPLSCHRFTCESAGYLLSLYEHLNQDITIHGQKIQTERNKDAYRHTSG